MGSTKPKKQNRNLVVQTKFTKIPNEVLERLYSSKLSGSAFQVIIFILRKTYGYSKKTDQLSLKQIEEGTGLSNRTICRGINELKKMGWIATSKDKNFRKHIPNQITILIGTTNVMIENEKLVDHTDDISKFLTTDKNDSSDIVNGKTTDRNDSRTTDRNDSSFEPKTTDKNDSRTTVKTVIHKRNIKKIREEKKEIQRITPVGFPSVNPSGKIAFESISSCKKEEPLTEEERKSMRVEVQEMIIDETGDSNNIDGGDEFTITEFDLEDPELEAALKEL